MNVHLTPQLESLVHAKVRGGRYNSASEVVREALRLMQERDELLELRKKEIAKQIAEGYESLSKGEGVPAGAAFRELDRRHEKSRQLHKRE
jgi:antitoxin ParD1/3/4